LEFGLDRADLAIDVPQKIFDLMLDVLFDLRALIIHHAKNGKACKHDEGQCGRYGQHREPCLNAEAAAPHEQSHQDLRALSEADYNGLAPCSTHAIRSRE